MKKIIASGKSIEEAVIHGLTALNTTEDRVKVTVLEQASRGLLGLIGSKVAKVELEMMPDAIEETKLFLADVFRSMKMNVIIDDHISNENMIFNLLGQDLGILIGRRGQTLDALQYLTNIVANRYSHTHMRIILDAENFRERRKATLEALALRLADKAVRYKKEVVLEPMSAQERKIIHYKLENHALIKTFSKGEEPNRRIVIALK